jgi:hypothetical protein
MTDEKKLVDLEKSYWQYMPIWAKVQPFVKKKNFKSQKKKKFNLNLNSL